MLPALQAHEVTRVPAAEEAVGLAMRDLAGRNAFVTGAASGIGLGICRALARAGVNVALADIEQAPLDAAVAEIAAPG